MSNQPYPPDPRMPNYSQQPQQNSYEGQYEAADNTIRTSNAGGAYMQSQHERYVDPSGHAVENRAEVFEDKNQSRANIRYWVTTIVYFILGVLEVIMLLRLIFRLLGANQENGFISFLYGLSHIFVGPFNGIFNDPPIGRAGVSFFEVSTVIAMLIYALIAWGIVSLARVVFAPIVPGRQSITTTRRSQH